MKTWTRPRYFLIHYPGLRREVVSSREEATREAYPGSLAAVGPFRTRRAAELMRNAGPNPNPCFGTVAACERIARDKATR